MRYVAPDAAVREAFHQGINARAYEMLGAHPDLQDGKQVWHFSVWAPNAKQVSLVGEFNDWDIHATPMVKQFDGTWEILLPTELFDPASHPGKYDCSDAADKLKTYKYAILTQNDEWHERADPYAFFSQLRPADASVLYDLSAYSWKDGEWMEARRKFEPYKKPVNIYEVHLGSWRRVGSTKDGLGNTGTDEKTGDTAGRVMTYLETADALIPYVKEMGYTHVEFMPVMEHPLDMSWGYQVTGFFSATSRYGTPAQFQEMIDRFHEAGIGVILDWVPAHFPRNESGLRLFDGTTCYEHPDPRKGEMPQWGTCMFDLARGEVQSFLLSSACFWLEWFHADGIRVDAVSAMVYLDFCREDGQWLPNHLGGREYLEGIAFLQKLNQTITRQFPGIMMIAEESHAFPGVTKSLAEGGLGFTFKWNMGWMNDILAYIKMDPIYRKWHHDKLTFSLFYAFSEHFILPFSHDEVVHGKCSMIDKQPGDIWKKFAGLRALYGYTMAHPGKKLMFMGNEFGQFIEWRYGEQLDWFLLLYDKHPQLQKCVKRLNEIYRTSPAFYEVDDSWSGFQWVQANDHDNSVVGFIRWDTHGNAILCMTNFTPVCHRDYQIGLPAAGTITEIMNTDAEEFGGSNQYNAEPIHTRREGWHEFQYTLSIIIPPLATVYFRYDRDDRTD